MLECGHDRAAFGWPVCTHLRVCKEPWLQYVRWYIGSGMDIELLCSPCADQRQKGQAVSVNAICEDCFNRVIDDVGDLAGVGGKPEVRVRSEPMGDVLKSTALPKHIGAVIDVAAVEWGRRSLWLLLSQN